MAASLGVSIVICSHDGALRLPPTLHHLIQQRTDPRLAWEVLIVDNASTDGTATAAQRLWPARAPAPLRIVHEPTLGLSLARHRGLREAAYAIVSFVDDDNWVSPDWVRTASATLSAHGDVGACGGFSEAVCEVDPPRWFEGVKASYAVGPQGSGRGDITWTRGFLWGAGLSIRKQAWQGLVDKGFAPLLTGRRGRELSAGEDAELCRALRLAGWRLWYEPALRLRHFLPAERLNWRYLRRLHRGFGASTTVLDAYAIAQLALGMQTTGRLRQTWRRQYLSTLRDMLRHPLDLGCSAIWSLEGSACSLKVEWQLGRLGELWRQRCRYDRNLQAVNNVRWHGLEALGHVPSVGAGGAPEPAPR